MLSYIVQLLVLVLCVLVPSSLAAQGSFVISPSIAEVGAGITVSYELEDYTPFVYDIIGIYASGEVSFMKNTSLSCFSDQISLYRLHQCTLSPLC